MMGFASPPEASASAPVFISTARRLVEFRAGRPSEYRLKLADGIVDACVDVLKVPRKWILVEFTPHVGEEIYRDGKWVADWTPEEGAPVPAT